MQLYSNVIKLMLYNDSNHGVQCLFTNLGSRDRWLKEMQEHFFFFPLTENTLLFWLNVKVLVTQSCPTLCDPMEYNPPSSSVLGILQARIQEWVAISFSKGFPTQESNPGLPYCRQILYHLSLQESPWILAERTAVSCHQVKGSCHQVKVAPAFS